MSQSNLRLIDETTTLTGVSTVNMENVFTTDFDIYLILGANFMANNSTATGVNMRLIQASNTVISTGIYDYAQEVHKGETSKGENKSDNETRIWNVFSGMDDGGQGSGGTIWLYNPTDTDKYTMMTWKSAGQPGGNLRGYNGHCIYPVQDKITGFQIELNEAAGEFLAGGKIRTYGLRVD